MESDIQEAPKCVFCDNLAFDRIGNKGLCSSCRRKLGNLMGETIVKIVQQRTGPSKR